MSNVQHRHPQNVADFLQQPGADRQLTPAPNSQIAAAHTARNALVIVSALSIAGLIGAGAGLAISTASAPAVATAAAPIDPVTAAALNMATAERQARQDTTTALIAAIDALKAANNRPVVVSPSAPTQAPVFNPSTARLTMDEWRQLHKRMPFVW